VARGRMQVAYQFFVPIHTPMPKSSLIFPSCRLQNLGKICLYALLYRLQSLSGACSSAIVQVSPDCCGIAHLLAALFESSQTYRILLQ
jgi:hypothetical protein